jgi:hypothetical protein
MIMFDYSMLTVHMKERYLCFHIRLLAVYVLYYTVVYVCMCCSRLTFPVFVHTCYVQQSHTTKDSTLCIFLYSNSVVHYILRNTYTCIHDHVIITL